MLGHLEVIKFLLSQGADATIATSKGETARDIAESEGYKRIVQLFDDPPVVDRELAATKDEESPPPPTPREKEQLDICKETKTYVWYFWGSKRKEYKVSVFDLIYAEGLKLDEYMRKELTAREDEKKEPLPGEDDKKKPTPEEDQKKLPNRWIHLPANNVRKLVLVCKRTC
jgi:hypothetical protein